MAAMIPKTTIEDIRARSDIVEVIGRYLSLQRAGSNYRALCPFHREKTPSFHVSPARQGFHCFGCGKGGDVFRFVMEHENVDFVTAARLLAEWAGMTLAPENSEDNIPDGPRKDVLYRLHDELAHWYHRQLMQAPPAQAARDYLAGRGLHSDTAADFMIGYAPDSWDAVLRWGNARGFSELEMLAAGVVVRREGEGRCYDRFRDRLMFPIRDEQKRVIAFSGRALQQKTESAKYINSPETVLFHKGRVLFGLDRARRAILDSREALVCEGQIDVIRCQISGFPTAVAAQGTAFTDNHAMRLARLSDGVVLAYDADDAGREAAFKTAAVCLRQGLAVRVAALPPGEDPDTLICQQGADVFGALLAKARGALDFRMDDLLQRHDPGTVIGMRALAGGITELIDSTPDPLQRDRMLQHAAQRLVIDPSVLNRGLRRAAARAGTAHGNAPETPVRNPVATDRPPAEMALIEHLAADQSLAALVRDYLPPQTMRDSACRAALELLLRAARDGESDVLACCSRQAPETDGIQTLLAAALLAPSRVTGKEFSREDALKDLILKIWREHLREKMQTLLRDDAVNESNAARMECAHLRTDIKRLGNWETGCAIIEMLREGF